jgi:phosphate transport system substrate-binding protein
VIVACSVAMAAKSEIRVGGEAEASNGLFAVIKEQILDETGIVPKITPTSSAQALLDLDAGSIDIATTDVPLENLITDLEQKGYLIVQDSFRVQGIGTNRILVYLNKSNSVPELSQRQLRDIFTGRITNWKQVGGNNQKIVVVWGEETPDQNRLYSKYVIGSGPIVRTAVKATDQHDIIERIVNTPGAIGIASNAYASGRTRNPKSPFVSAKVLAITKGAPTDDAQKVLEVVKSFDF